MFNYTTLFVVGFSDLQYFTFQELTLKWYFKEYPKRGIVYKVCVSFLFLIKKDIQYLHFMKKESDNFFDKVYKTARLIPHGRVTSYGAIANYLGAARSARMVGWAMNNSHNQTEEVPAHRVVNRKGLLTGKHHFDGTNLMQQLLESEGIVVIENQIQNFEKVFWNPMSEL